MRTPTLEEERDNILSMVENQYPRYIDKVGITDSPQARIDYYAIAIDELGKNYREYPELVDQLIAGLVRLTNRQRNKLVANRKNEFRFQSTPKE